MRVVLKVGRKGIIILPKKLRKALGINEEDEVIVEVTGDRLVLKALKPRVVDVDPELVKELLREEYSLEAGRYEGMIPRGETSS